MRLESRGAGVADLADGDERRVPPASFALGSEGRFVYGPRYVETVAGPAGLRVLLKEEHSLRSDDVRSHLLYVLSKVSGGGDGGG